MVDDRSLLWGWNREKAYLEQQAWLNLIAALHVYAREEKCQESYNTAVRNKTDFYHFCLFSPCLGLDEISRNPLRAERGLEMT